MSLEDKETWTKKYEALRSLPRSLLPEFYVDVAREYMRATSGKQCLVLEEWTAQERLTLLRELQTYENSGRILHFDRRPGTSPAEPPDLFWFMETYRVEGKYFRVRNDVWSKPDGIDAREWREIWNGQRDEERERNCKIPTRE